MDELKPFISEEVLRELRRVFDEYKHKCKEWKSIHNHHCEGCPWYDAGRNMCFANAIKLVVDGLNTHCHVTTTHKVQNFTARVGEEVVLNLENAEITSFKEIERR